MPYDEDVWQFYDTTSLKKRETWRDEGLVSNDLSHWFIIDRLFSHWSALFLLFRMKWRSNWYYQWSNCAMILFCFVLFFSSPQIVTKKKPFHAWKDRELARSIRELNDWGVGWIWKGFEVGWWWWWWWWWWLCWWNKEWEWKIGRGANEWKWFQKRKKNWT